MLVDLGLVDAIMTALRAHSGSAEVLEAAARALAVVIDCTDTLAVVDAEGMFNTSTCFDVIANVVKGRFRCLKGLLWSRRLCLCVFGAVPLFLCL